MEEKVLRLMAQLGLIALIVWVIAGAMGKRNQAAVKHTRKRRQDPKSPVWNQSPVQAPSASAGLMFSAGAVM
jgi:hypothetical protein